LVKKTVLPADVTSSISTLFNSHYLDMSKLSDPLIDINFIKEVLNDLLSKYKGVELQLLSFLVEIRKRNKESIDELNTLVSRVLNIEDNYADLRLQLKATPKPSVYIGYHWAQKDIGLKLCKDLSNHFNCYTYDKTGLYSVDASILGDVVVFICCLTSDYTNNNVTLEELQLAFNKNKYIIPVLLSMSSWDYNSAFIKFITGKFYIDFTTQHKYKTNLPKLINFVEKAILY